MQTFKRIIFCITYFFSERIITSISAHMYTGNEEADSNSSRNVNYSYRQIVLADSVQFKYYDLSIWISPCYLSEMI